MNFKRVAEVREKIGGVQEKMSAMVDKIESEKRNLTEEEKNYWQTLLELRNTLADELDSYNSEAFSIASKQDDDQEDRTFTIYNKTKATNQISDWYQRNFDVPEAFRSITPGEFIRAKLIEGLPDSGIKLTEKEQRAVNETTNSQGGFAVPEILMAKVMDNVRAKSHVLSSGAQTILLDSKSQKMAKIIGDPTTEWVAENGTITASDPTFSSVNWVAKKLVSRIDASGEWLQDAVGGSSALEMVLSNAIAGELDKSALIGAGSSTEPKGIFSYASAAIYEMANNGAALTNYDAYFEVIKLLQDNNANNPTVAIMAPRTFLAQSKLKEATTNAYLALPPGLSGMQFKQTSKIPVNQTQGTSNAASSIFLGNFESLVLGQRLALTIIPTYQLVGTNYQYTFLAVTRADWQPVREQNFGVIKGVL